MKIYHFIVICYGEVFGMLLALYYREKKRCILLQLSSIAIYYINDVMLFRSPSFPHSSCDNCCLLATKLSAGMTRSICRLIPLAYLLKYSVRQ